MQEYIQSQKLRLSQTHRLYTYEALLISPKDLQSGKITPISIEAMCTDFMQCSTIMQLSSFRPPFASSVLLFFARIFSITSCQLLHTSVQHLSSQMLI